MFLETSGSLADSLGASRPQYKPQYVSGSSGCKWASVRTGVDLSGCKWASVQVVRISVLRPCEVGFCGLCDVCVGIRGRIHGESPKIKFKECSRLLFGEFSSSEAAEEKSGVFGEIFVLLFIGTVHRYCSSTVHRRDSALFIVFPFSFSFNHCQGECMTVGP
ncbi:unnamed protein product [Microthlaspi erraticum]|uniref:Uncharacterized protein n=1 Tax=Microthlaspi erraticum TaxID=1685480 RepID=A0A6D2IYL9_9BRAS|nr:unnamed protein product [Microthlaspi erraticum]